MSTILKITNLVKYYSSDEPVIKRLSLEVKKGEVFGFIGPNGAGKSTTIKCITGILPFEEGEITINNLDILQEPLDAKRSFGYVADNQAVYEEMTGREFVEFIASVYGLKENFKHLFEELVKRFNMSHAIDQYISNY
jgi:ABC-2 type transport system ATP-binding protein